MRCAESRRDRGHSFLYRNCDMVGMTGMPECALARELELCYATCAAGRGEGPITMEDIDRNVKAGMSQVCTLMDKVISKL